MNNNLKLYNVIFPIWLLWLFPIAWFIVIPTNFIIDLLVIFLIMKKLNLKDIRENIKKSIMKVCLFGFFADLIGSAILLIVNMIEFNNNEWWYNFTSAISYNPFKNIYALLFVIIIIIITSFLIYFFNYKISLRGIKIDNADKKRIALALAVFTAPYLFLLPTMWFY